MWYRHQCLLRLASSRLLITYMLQTNLPINLVGVCLSCAFWFCTKSNVPPVHLEWISVFPLYPELSILAFGFEADSTR